MIKNTNHSSTKIVLKRVLETADLSSVKNMYLFRKLEDTFQRVILEQYLQIICSKKLNPSHVNQVRAMQIVIEYVQQ